MVFGFLKACSFFDCAAYNESAPERTPEHLLEVRHFYVELFPFNRRARACRGTSCHIVHVVPSGVKSSESNPNQGLIRKAGDSCTIACFRAFCALRLPDLHLGIVAGGLESD